MDSRYLVAATAASVASAGFLTGSPALAADPVKIKPLVIAPAANPLSGYVGAYVGVGHYDSRKYGDCVDCTNTGGFHVLGGAGALNYWLSPNRSLQFDVYGSGTGKFAAAIHHTHRNGPGNLWGLMFGLGSSGNGGNWMGVAAVEGQMYHGPNGVTLYGQAGGVFSLEGGSSGVYAAGEARWFTTPDTKFSIDANIGTFGSSTLFGVGAMVEHKLMGMPISVFARGQFDVDSYKPYGRDKTVTGFLGINFIVNQRSLKDQNDNGATLLDKNPIFGQFANQAW